MSSYIKYTLLYILIPLTFDPFAMLLSEGSILKSIYLRIMQLVSFGVIVYFLPKVKDKTPLQILGVYLLCILMSSVLNHSLYSCIARIYPIVTYFALMQWVCQDYYRFSVFIKAVSKVHIIALCVNLFLSVLMPKMFDDHYLLGNENQVGFILLVGFAYNALNYYINGGKVQFVIFTTLLILNDILVWSGGTLVGLAVLLVCFFTPYVREIISKTRLLILLLAYSIVFVVFVFFNSTGILDGTIIELIVVDVLGKDMTFTNRTLLWYEAVLMIAENPFIGYGIPDDGNIITHIDKTGYGRDLSTHNQILQLLYEGGVIVLISLLFVFLYLGVKMEKSLGSNIKILLKSVILALLFMYLVEAPGLNYLFELLILSFGIIYLKSSNGIVMTVRNRMKY